MSSWNVIIKTPKQIEGIRKACKIAAETLAMIWNYIKPWISTEELDHICNAFIIKSWWKSACIWYNWYPKYTCISLNDTICHGIPSKNEILKTWDILNIDVTVIKDWYFWDTGRMFTVWEIPKIVKDLIAVTYDALQIWIDESKPWNYSWNIWYKIANFVEPKWFSVVREYTGHGTWLAFHEEPFIYHKAPKNSGIILKPGMIFTIEPMINIWTYKTKILSDKWTVKTHDGGLSAQVEDTLLITEDGNEVLTRV
jgi:methionyl aminopeptidase